MQHLPRVDIVGIACPCSEPKGPMRGEFKLIQKCSFQFENIPVNHTFKQKRVWAQNHILKGRRSERGSDSEAVCLDAMFSSLSVLIRCFHEPGGKETALLNILPCSLKLPCMKNQFHLQKDETENVWSSQQPKVLLHWGCNIAVKKCLNARPRVGEITA